VELEATTNEGYDFLGWYVEGMCVSSSEIYRFSAVMDMNVEARWEKTEEVKQNYTITLTKNIAKAGTVTGNGEYKEGSTVALSATCNLGYSFVGWFMNGAPVSYNTSCTVVVRQNLRIEARWESNDEKRDITIVKNRPDAGTV
jgi:hypothetical protein